MTVNKNNNTNSTIDPTVVRVRAIYRKENIYGEVPGASKTWGRNKRHNKKNHVFW